MTEGDDLINSTDPRVRRCLAEFDRELDSQRQDHQLAESGASLPH